MLREAFNAVGVRLDRVTGSFFEDALFGQLAAVENSTSAAQASTSCWAKCIHP